MFAKNATVHSIFIFILSIHPRVSLISRMIRPCTPAISYILPREQSDGTIPRGHTTFLPSFLNHSLIMTTKSNHWSLQTSHVTPQSITFSICVGGGTLGQDHGYSCQLLSISHINQQCGTEALENVTRNHKFTFVLLHENPE